MVVRVAVEMGINRVRLSGGEPLARTGLVNLITMLSQIKEIDDLSLTTNGVLLKYQAAQLKEAGLHRVNISLDTLKRPKFQEITGYDKLPEVLEGIAQAHRAGLAPIKINVVVMRGINDDELPDFALLSKEGWHVRFIELMPLVNRNPNIAVGIPEYRVGAEHLPMKGAAITDFKTDVKQPDFVSAKEMWSSLASLGKLQPCSPPNGSGPARYYRLPSAKGTIGFIAPISEHFCFRCNRLRLTADGRLLPCLLADQEIDLRTPLRGGASPQQIRRLILEAIASKPEGHQVAQGFVPQRRFMAQVGG